MEIHSFTFREWALLSNCFYRYSLSLGWLKCHILPLFDHFWLWHMQGKLYSTTMIHPNARKKIWFFMNLAYNRPVKLWINPSKVIEASLSNMTLYYKTLVKSAKMILRYRPKSDSKFHWNVHILENSNNHNFSSQCAVKLSDTFFTAWSIKFLNLQ